MKPSAAPHTYLARQFLFILLFLCLPFIALAQQKGTVSAPSPAPAPKPAPAPAAKPAPAPDAHHEGGSDHEPEAHPGGTAGTSPHVAGNTGSGSSAGNNTFNTPKTATKRATPGPNNANRAGGTGGANGSTTPKVETDPRAPTGLNLRPRAVNTSSGENKASGTGSARTNSSSAGGGAKGAAGANNQPGATKLPNGGTRTTHADGSTVDRSRTGKLTGVTTSKGATAKMDTRGRATAIHDAKGTTISRGPHGERRIETTRADHTRLVSNGKQGGFGERRFTRSGHEFAQRTYYSNGAYSSRVYVPYYYGGYPFYEYVPAVYYDPAFYGWAYTPWPVDVAFTWGWMGAAWYTPYGYYFVPYAVYPAPAFWLADYAMAQSLQTGSEDAADAAAEGSDSSRLWDGSGFVLASAHASQLNQGAAPAVVTNATKDQIAEQVKQMIADEKDASTKPVSAAAAPGSPPKIPPSLDSRFVLFIASSELSLETGDTACSLTAGDIIRRKEITPDANGTVAVELVSGKKGDCSAGMAGRLKVDDLEEMHDNFRAKIDDGLKSLAGTQGKGGIPPGPAAKPRDVPEGQADPDTSVADELKKQQQAADATEKDVKAASSEGGSAD